VLRVAAIKRESTVGSSSSDVRRSFGPVPAKLESIERLFETNQSFQSFYNEHGASLTAPKYLRESILPEAPEFRNEFSTIFNGLEDGIPAYPFGGISIKQFRGNAYFRLWRKPRCMSMSNGVYDSGCFLRAYTVSDYS
jgi:hypothetical protein